MTWDDFINAELKQTYFQNLVTYLKHEDQMKTILPTKENRLSCLKLTPYNAVKVVIIGQDPYHNFHQAHGLAFSVEQGVFPPSLRNIYKELVDDMHVAYPTTGNLTKWAKQGVLLLNTVLTVEVHKPLSHKDKGWEIFTLNIVKKINEIQHPVVFILWGAHAQKFKMYVDEKKHLMITSVHPSPLSASRGFFGSKPFSKTNTFLIKNQLEPIDWSLS